jgi:hypothetical protein
LCDPDHVEPSNLSRCVLFTDDDRGRAKVDAAAGALARLRPGTAVAARRATLTAGVGLSELAAAQVVLGCLDTRRARLELLGRCALAGAALVDGGTGPWSGEVRIRTSPDAPCYGCSLTSYERGEGDLPRDCGEAQPPGETPASIATTALVASWMTVAALRILLGRPTGYEALRIEALTGSTAPLRFARDPQCPYHEPLPSVTQSLAVTNSDNVATLLTAIPQTVDVHTWSAFPAAIFCLRCHSLAGYDGLNGSAGLPRCAQCGATVRRRTTQRLAEADPSARLSSLGIAPREILLVRTAEGDDQWVQLAG